MKIARADDSFILQLARQEQLLLLNLLELYPCIPAAHHLKASSQEEPSRILLDEALQEQRAETKKELKQFLAHSRRFEKTETGWRLSLSASEMEWLLQILNDIRVGNWIVLGSPEAKESMTPLDESTFTAFWRMELAGQFEMELLRALKS